MGDVQVLEVAAFRILGIRSENPSMASLFQISLHLCNLDHVRHTDFFRYGTMLSFREKKFDEVLPMIGLSLPLSSIDAKDLAMKRLDISRGNLVVDPKGFHANSCTKVREAFQYKFSTFLMKFLLLSWHTI
jgi:hypothetical protein